MTLLSDDTLWIFFAASNDGNIGTNHINNIVKGIKSLESNNIKSSNITLLIDGNEPLLTNELNKKYPKCNSKYKVKPSKNLLEVIEKSSHKNIVVFVTGHGNPNGIDCYTPDEFMNIFIKGNPNKTTVIYFGQCYSNIFRNTTACKSNKIIMFGVNTKKSPVYKLPSENSEYTIFLYWLFDWINNLKNITDINNRSVFASAYYAMYKTIESNKIAEIGNKQHIKYLENKLQTIEQNSTEYEIISKELYETNKDSYIDKIDTWYNIEGEKLAHNLKY